VIKGYQNQREKEGMHGSDGVQGIKGDVGTRGEKEDQGLIGPKGEPIGGLLYV